MKVCSPTLETPEWNSPRDEWWKNKWRENKWREVKRRKDKWGEGKRRKDKWVKTGRFAAPSQETNWFQFSWYWGVHPWHNKWSKDYGQSARQNQVRQFASVPRQGVKDKAGKLLSVYFGGCKVIAKRIRVHSIAWKKNVLHLSFPVTRKKVLKWLGSILGWLESSSDPIPVSYLEPFMY